MPVLISASVILGTAAVGAGLGAAVGYRLGCYSVWRLVTARMSRPV